MSRRDRLICSSNSSRNRRLGNWICRMPPLWVVAEIWVKSGEEWWRVEPTLHLAKRPVYRGLQGMGEEWRVFHASIVYSNLEIKNPWCWSLFSISYCRFYYAVWTANWQIWRQLAVLGKTVNCSGSASLLFYVNSKLARPIYIINKNMIIEWLKNAHPLCHLVHSEWHFVQGKLGYLADRNNLLTFALVIGKRLKNDSWNEENEV